MHLTKIEKFQSLHSHGKKVRKYGPNGLPYAIFVEYQAILEPILLSRASKYKQTKRTGC